jgi:hypothetical protein
VNPVPPARVPRAPWPPPWALAVSLTLLCLTLRLQALPGDWGTDALSYAETALSGRGPDADPRTQRRLFLALAGGAWRLGGHDPAWASLPGVLLSACVPTVLWLALRSRVGAGLALLPAALFTFLGLDLEEVVELSADAALALPGALAVAGLVVAQRRVGAAGRPARLAALALAGVAVGVGVALKETMLLAALGFLAGSLALGRGRERLWNAVAFAGPATLVTGVALALASPERLAVASQNIAAVEAPVRWGAAGFLYRFTVGLPANLLTATGAWGVLFVGALPLLLRLPVRALRGDALAAAAVVGLLAFAWAPVSLERYALLPADFPRYLLCLVPVLFAALVCALAEPPRGRVERGLVWAGAAVGLLFASRSPWTAFVVPAALALTAWPALPSRVAERLPERARLALVSSALLLAVVTDWRLERVLGAAGWAWVAVVGVSAAVAAWAWRVRAALVAAPVLALATALTLARFPPDPTWDLWERLPARGAVFADQRLARQLRLSAVGDAERLARVLPLGTALPPLVADDRVLVLAATPLGARFSADPTLRPAPRVGKALLLGPR